MATWERAGKLRRDLADTIEGLSPEQLQQKSLCDEWTNEGVLAHVTSFVATGFPKFMLTVAKHRGNFDSASLEMAQTQLDRPTADVLATLRAKSTKSSALPIFPEELTMADTMIHTQDVKRPLGLPASFDEQSQRTALEFLTSHKMATTLVNRPPIEDVKLTASDLDWSFGEGAEISGTAEAIMMGLAARPSALDDLSGDGVDLWR